LLASNVNSSKKTYRHQAPTTPAATGIASRRLIGARYSDAAPQTALAAALLRALTRRAGQS